MKKEIPVYLSSLPCLMLLMYLVPRGFCVERIHCQWGPYGDWSECDGCTKTQTRSRTMVVYAQFDGTPCGGESTETQRCETTQGCPLEDGCGDRFRCRSGQCVSMSLVCNGDQDCEEDGDDERGCDSSQRYVVCDRHPVLPPNIELLGLGFDAVTGETRGVVINTKSFGGQCRPIFSGDHRSFYRLPMSTLQYNFMVKVQNDFSEEVFSSEWHYNKDIVNRETLTGTTSGYRNYDFHESKNKVQNRQLLVSKSVVEVAQFRSNAQKYLPISEVFWKALVKLPTVYNYAAYRKVLDRFGTHYVSAGTLGASLKVVVSIDQVTYDHAVREESKHDVCETTVSWILFIRLNRESCDKGGKESPFSSSGSSNNVVSRVEVEGGDPKYKTMLEDMSPANQNNWDMYTNWAESVRSFPKVIEKQLEPVSELVKEVQCAGVKRLYLRRAIEQYLADQHRCHCRPCENNGLVIRDGDECKCICNIGTSGLACEHGAEVEGQQGVIHGSWSCWSRWTSCSGDRRSRWRSCTNPAPQNGGQHCNGEPSETTHCEDQLLQYLRTMEPQCFDASLPAKEKCGTPPTLINGFVLDPKDVYLVGSRIEYSCTETYHLIGNSILECSADLTWSGTPGLCKVSACRLGSTSDITSGITVTPWKTSYLIGERITLSCPEGRQVLGETEVICDSSLNFSPDPAGIRCSEASQQQQGPRPTQPAVQCRLWERAVQGRCVCKMPLQCTSSLEVCATIPGMRTSTLLNVCKMHALQCLGRSLNLTEDSACQWPKHATAACSQCPLWETCDDGSSTCRCRVSAECLVPGLSVCVRVGEDRTADTQTMTECEAGLRRCSGETVSVVGILPCEP